MNDIGVQSALWPVVVFLSPIISSLILTVGAGAVAAQMPTVAYNVSIGHPASFNLVSGRLSAVRIDLSGPGSEEILIQTAGPGTTYRVVSNDGIQIQSGRAETAGWLAIPLNTTGQNQIQLRLSIDASLTDQTPFRVRVDSQCIPSETFKSNAKAAQFLSAAQALRYSLHGDDLDQAIAEYRQAATDWEHAGDTYGEAIALGGEAESQFELSRFSDATQTLDRATRLDGENGYVRAWLTHLKARAYLDEWESKAAERYAQESLKIGKATNEPTIVGEALADLAEAHYWRSDKLAASYAEGALLKARETGLPKTVAYCLRVQAFEEEELGHLPHAASLMTEAEASFRQSGDPRLTLETAEYLTSVEGRAGDDFGALTRFAKLEPLSKNTGNLVDYGILIQNIGNEYVSLHRLKTAGVYFQMARDVFLRAHFKSGRSMAQGKICEVEFRSQEPNDAEGSKMLKSALSDCEISAAIAEEIQDPYRIAIAKYQIGQVYQRMALVHSKLAMSQLAHEENDRALDFFTSAAAISHSVDDKRSEENERISLGEVLDTLGMRQKSRAEFEKALSLSKDEENSEGILEAQFHIAAWYEYDNQQEFAEEALSLALEQLENSRRLVSNGTLQASYFAAERKCYELAVELQMQKYERDPAAGGDAHALEMSEASRARGLLDALTARNVPGVRTSSDIQGVLMQSRISVDQTFDRRLKLLLTDGSKRNLEANASEMVRALGALERAEDEVYLPSNSPNSPTKTMKATEIESASERSDATYLEYALGAKRSYLWVIDHGVLKSHVLPPREEIEDLIKQWRALVTPVDETTALSNSKGRSQSESHKDFQRLSAKLSCVLFGNAVESRMTRLVIVADGNLAMLPFAALPENACSSVSGVPLVSGHEIILAPSLSVFLPIKAPTAERSYKGEVAVVADSVFDKEDARVQRNQASSRSATEPNFSDTNASLPRLFNTSVEAKAIRETVGNEQTFLALGFDASVETVLSAKMQDYRIWHLATHGVYDETAPEFSGLVFSLVSKDGSPVYGFLKAQDIAYMQFQPELVVLSACDSAAGEILSGEGAMGLSYSFLRAGAKSVVSTLWSVDDSISAELMADFYQEMMRNGNNAADALRQSQLTVMRRHKNSTPYSWAGFELTSVGN